MATYKVIGIGQHEKFSDNDSYRYAIHYILDPGKVVFFGGANVTSVVNAAQEMENVSIAFGKNSGKRLRHSVLSFDPNECNLAHVAADYAQKIIEHYAPAFQIVFAVHGNTSHIHIHFVMNHISFIDGHRYEGKKYDYYAFKRHMQAVTRLPIIMIK